MPPDSYKVEVIYYINPYLIWIEVCDPNVVKDEYIFEQVGIYGVLPLETTLDIEDEVIKIQKCDDWIAAATTLMKNVFVDSSEVWFSPTYIDRRTSIFDDNIHKYGELIIKYKNGDLKHLSKLLVKSNLAYYDVCEFHQQLGAGKIKTKLSSRKTQDVVTEIENYYTKASTTKKKCTKSIKKQTTVFRIAQDIESALTVANLEKHNNEMLNKMLENKMKDLELCKDIDEESLGRGFVKSKEQSIKNQSPPSTTDQSHQETQGFSQAFDDIKVFLDANAKTKNDKSKNDKPANPAIKDTVNKKIKGTNLSKKLYSINQIERDKMNRLRMKHKLNVEKQSIIEKTDSHVQSHQHVTNNEVKESVSRSGILEKKRNHKVIANSKRNLFQIAYGPPELDPTHWKIIEADYDEQDYVKLENNTENVNIESRDQIFEDVNSEVSDEVNRKVLSDYYNSIKFVKKKNTPKAIAKEEMKMDVKTKEHLQNVGNDDSSDKQLSSASSLLLKKKLGAYNNVSKHNSSFSSSDTSNKDTSSLSDNNKTFDNDPDEKIDEVIRRIDEQYKVVPAIKNKQKSDFPTVTKLKNNVNPFKNIDPQISVFVDKLVAPILLVHTKKNKRIEPVFEMRDVFFNSHIHLVLRNMSIERPMMVQSVSWNTILRGYSLFMISPPNSGKTLGYLPAVCRYISDANCDSDCVGPICIIVCATAKSVTYIEEMAKMFLGLDHKVLACYAGVDDLYITSQLLNGCDLLISTPSSLIRLMQLNDFGIDMRRLSIFVFDDCERLAITYQDEIKYFLFKLKETVKARANNELKVQYVLASRVWCDFMGSLALKTPDTVISFSAFQECVLYSKASTSVSFVDVENKVDIVFEFLKEIDESKRTVIVCKSDDEVDLLEKALKRSKHAVFACNNNMTVHDLYNLSVSWADYEVPLVGPILICCDGNLTHMNVTDAHNLIHFSLPQLFSMFCKRFCVLNDNYPSIFKADNENVKIKIILDDSNVEQLPKIMNFIKRCTNNVPEFLDEVCTKILKEKDVNRAKNHIPICDKMLMLGSCPDFFNCQERHTILEEYDKPQEWLPKDGLITFRILHYHNAVLYSARLLTNIVNGVTTKYPQTYNSLSLKMGMYYSKESNRRLHGIPNVGDICAASTKLNLFVRCQVIKILSRYPNGNPNTLLINLLDEEKYEITRDIYLYHLPDDLKIIQTSVVLVRLTNLIPKDKDITFSDLASDELKKITNNEDLFMTGHVVLTIGNCVFVDTLEACQELTSLNETVEKHNLKQELLENHAQLNPDHIQRLEQMCIESGVLDKKEIEMPQTQNPVKNLPKGTWAYLESDKLSAVFLASSRSPDKFFVRLDKFESWMSALLEDIKKYVEAYTSTTDISNVKEGDLVLAEFPEDETFERARIDGLNGDKAKCFFVDQGDCKEIPLKGLIPITEQFINQLPFQAIECRLIGIQPPGDDWSDFSKNWFFDNCFEDKNGRLKLSYIKYYTKETAEFTNGYKYGVVVIDTTTDKDVIINQLMIDLNLARENIEEKEYLNKIHLELNELDTKQSTKEESDDDWEKLSDATQDVEKRITQIPQPVRSVPLVDSDSDSDRWEVNMSTEVLATLFPGLKSCFNNGNVAQNEERDASKDKVFKSDDNVTHTGHDINENNNQIIPLAPIAAKETQELDSDDLTSSEISLNVTEKPIIPEVDQKRRPKLLWRQTKDIVYIKIQLIAVEDYDLEIDARFLKFSSNVNDTEYEFNIELYGVVDKEKSTHVKNGLYIMVKLIKVLAKNWVSLTKSYDTKNWIVYDVDDIDTSSDEDEVDKIAVEKIVKNMCDVDSESEDDEFLDDVNR